MTNNVTITAQTIFRMVGEGVVDEVHLSAEAWRLLAQVNSARSVEEIAQNLKIDPALVAKTARALLNLGLLGVENHTTPPATVDAAFFEYIDHEVLKTIGPIGPILIEEAVANLGEARERFPREKLAALVERVAEQIPNEKKRLDFLRIMLTEIRKSG